MVMIMIVIIYFPLKSGPLRLILWCIANTEARDHSLRSFHRFGKQQLKWHAFVY